MAVICSELITGTEQPPAYTLRSDISQAPRTPPHLSPNIKHTKHLCLDTMSICGICCYWHWYRCCWFWRGYWCCCCWHECWCCFPIERNKTSKLLSWKGKPMSCHVKSSSDSWNSNCFHTTLASQKHWVFFACFYLCLNS